MRHGDHGVFRAWLAVLLSMSVAPAHSADQARRDGAGGHAHERLHGDAIGMPGDPARASRTVTVDMTDTMRFVPAKVAVRQGETIRFVVRNTGRLQHEFVLGTAKELQAHEGAVTVGAAKRGADPHAGHRH